MLGVDGQVTSLRVDRIGAGRGFICSVLQLVPSYVGATSIAPKSLIAKLPGTLSQPPWMIEWIRQFIRAEHAWYREEHGNCGLRAPCLYAAQWDGPNAHVLLLEDFTHLTALEPLAACTAARISSGDGCKVWIGS